MSDKCFKTIDEQIEILTSRGLTIPNLEQASTFLQRNNYYRISGYSLTLRSNNVFYKKATFQNIIDIYEFDHELRHILLKYIEMIEVAVKSIYSYEFTRKYGPCGYLNSSNFTDTVKHEYILKKVNEQKDKRLSSEAYLKHFVNELKQDIPLWAYIDLFTISDISILYSISDSEIKKQVADALSIKHKGAKLLENFMHGITIIRNLCAHGGRLYNRLFEHKPSLSKAEQTFLIKNKDGSIDNAHLYGFIFVIRKLLKPDEFSAMKAEIINLTNRCPFVSMRYYGFRDDWKSIL